MEALAINRSTLVLRVSLQGFDHADTHITWANIVELLIALGLNDEAKNQAQLSLSAQEGTTTSQNPDVVRMVSVLEERLRDLALREQKG